ncbi:putative uncharacterized protein [Clostridium sp. CAG:492]|jgi:hypothetical protein|nr:putative uncharacterized protein [Clostridium sp. CAG:492]
MGEPQNENDLFFVCSFIEYIARKTNNKKSYIVKKIGKELLQKIYNLAEVYHSENIEKVSDEIIEQSKIERGNYDIIGNCKYNIPTYWDIGKVYKRLILMVNNDENEYINTLYSVLSSWIIEKIDNYNSSMYYENPDYIYECYKEGKVI